LIRAAALVTMLGIAPAFAQIAAPVLGYLPDGGRLRPVYGIPATAVVGPAVDIGRDLDRVAVSPRQNYVLATAAGNGEALLITPGVSVVHLEGAAPGADRIVMSPHGSAAALWFPVTSHLQIVSGLPLSPSVLDIDTTFRGAPPDALAVSDDGQWVAGAWPDGVYVLGAAGQVNRLPVDAGTMALAFFHGRPDLAVATPTAILTIAGVGGSAVPAVVYNGSASPLSPVAIALSFDNLRLAAADRGGALLTVDLSTGAAAALDCSCSPEGLFPMGGSVFRLTGLGPGALKLFEAATGDVLFAPLAASAGGLP
jgi:hypothetical protein